MGDKAPTMAAALAYYAFFSVAPVVIIAIAVAGLVFGPEAARGEISRQLHGLIGREGAQAVEGLIASASGRKAGTLATVIGTLATMFGATGVFAELHGSLNTIWKVRLKRVGLIGFLRTRFLSFAVVLGIGFLLLVSLVLSAALAVIGGRLSSAFAQWAWLGESLNTLLSFGVISVLFAMIFKLLPQTRVAWRDVWLGGTVTSALFILGKFLLGLYLAKSAILSTYGAAASLAALLLWVYYSSMILLFGAELSHRIAVNGGRVRVAEPPREQPSGQLVPGAH